MFLAEAFHIALVPPPKVVELVNFLLVGERKVLVPISNAIEVLLLRRAPAFLTLLALLAFG